MSYLQIEIGGKLRDLRFTQGTNILVRDKIKNYEDADKLAFGGYVVFWGALKTGCILNDAPVDFSFKDACEWFDNLKAEEISQITAAYQEINDIKSDKPDEEKILDEEEKKRIRNYKSDCYRLAGKLGWTEMDLFKSSPESFYYAVEGYYDKEEAASLVIRKLAQVVFGSQGGKPHEFDSFWPLPERFKHEGSDIPAWAATSKEMRKEILKKLGIIPPNSTN